MAKSSFLLCILCIFFITIYRENNNNKQKMMIKKQTFNMNYGVVNKIVKQTYKQKNKNNTKFFTA